MTVCRLLDLLQEECQELTWAEAYADGCSDNGKGILACNWNTESLLHRSCRADRALQSAHARVNKLQRFLYGGYHTEHGGRPMPKNPSLFPALTREALRVAREALQRALQPWDDKARRIGDILERAGYSLEWSDQGHTCGGCNRWIQTCPDSFSYRPDYQLTDGDIYCGDCCRENLTADLEQFFDRADGPTPLHQCEFAENLDLRATWQAIEGLEDDDLTSWDADHAALDALKRHRWPAIHHEGQAVFRTPHGVEHLETWEEDGEECPGCGVVSPSTHWDDNDECCPSCGERDEGELPRVLESARWWAWYCSPGCLPDSDLLGPYECELAAILANASEEV